MDEEPLGGFLPVSSERLVVYGKVWTSALVSAYHANTPCQINTTAHTTTLDVQQQHTIMPTYITSKTKTLVKTFMPYNKTKHKQQCLVICTIFLIKQMQSLTVKVYGLCRGTVKYLFIRFNLNIIFYLTK